MAKTKHMRLPNGFGQISEIKGRNLRNPWRAMITVGKTETGKPICQILKPQGYFKTYNDAYAALIKYNENPYDLNDVMTVGELYEKWTLEYFKQIAASSQRTIKSAWSYCGSVENIMARDLRVRHIKGCMDSCDKPNVKNRIKSMMNIMFDYALEYEIVDKNYARDFKVETVEVANGHNSYTDDEMNIMWNNASIPMISIILINCYTGWRPQELCELRLSDVNIIDCSMKGGMKTEAGKNRAVPISSVILDMAKNIYNMSEMLGSEYFICNNDGSHITYDAFYKKYKAVMNDIGIDGHKPHDSRKHFITMCKKYNVDEYAIKYMAGHSIADLTERVYTDRDFEWLRKEIEKVKRA